MVNHCRSCGASVADDPSFCPRCEAEMSPAPLAARYESLGQAARQIARLLAAVFLVKGAWAAVGALSYRDLAAAIGFPAHSDAVHYAGATIALVAGLLYVVVSLGGYLQATWRFRMAAVATAVVVVGQLAVRFAAASSAPDDARYFHAAALVVFWCALPVVQLILSLLARR